jgi:hypothetical protein
MCKIKLLILTEAQMHRVALLLSITAVCLVSASILPREYRESLNLRPLDSRSDIVVADFEFSGTLVPCNIILANSDRPCSRPIGDEFPDPTRHINAFLIIHSSTFLALCSVCFD